MKKEEEIKHLLPKKLNTEFKKHYLIYILGLFLLVILIGCFTITYAKNIKETKRNQDLLQQQINIQKEQLELQTKQIENNKAKTTASTPITTQIKAITPVKPTCDEAKQQDQKQVLLTHINRIETDINNWESTIRQSEANLQKPKPYDTEYDEYLIKRGNQAIADDKTNIGLRNENLEDIKNCTLMSDTVIDIFRK